MSGILLAVWIVAFTQATEQARPTVRFSTGSTPDVVTIGDRFRALIRVSSAPGARVEFSASIDSTGAVQQTDSMRVVVREDGEWTAVYPLVAWQVGRPTVSPVPVRVILPDGVEQRFQVDLRLPEVRSVLPSDSSRLEPRSPKDIVVGRWNRQLLALLVLGIALLLVGLGILWRRSRRREEPEIVLPMAPRSAREEALAALEGARTLPISTAGERKKFYTVVSDTLRRYMAVVSPHWGLELTTSELIGRLQREGIESETRDALRAVLAEADRVKFARHPSTPEEAERTRQRAVDWVSGFPPSRQLVGAGTAGGEQEEW